MTLVEKYKGHVEYAEGHVHYLPISAIWNVVCYRCEGDVMCGRSGRRQTTTRAEGISWLESHVAENHA